MKKKYLLLSMILFVFLVLFSSTSLSLIPGDFGSADNGPSDGVVDFEDLMIFALAYGSTPSDGNWNEACDIASEGGVLQPDGVIDFEDLMIFALHYGEEVDEIEEIASEILETQDFVEQYFKQLESQNDPNALQKTINYLKTQQNVNNAEVGEDGASIWIEYKSGVEGIILTEPFRSLGSFPASTLYRSDLSRRSADKNSIILLPFNSVPGYEDESVEAISTYLQQSAYAVPDIYSNEEVTIDLMKTLCNYDFIYMATHGATRYYPHDVSILTGQIADSNIFYELWTYLINAEIQIGTAGGNSYFALNGKFFTHYTYPDSFVYINACSSLKNNSLADVFLNNGASVYLGWDNTSFLTLGNIHNPEFFQELAKPNNTLQQAYDNTIAMHYPAIVYKDTNGNDKYRVKFLSGEDEGDQDDTIIDYDLSLVFKGNSQFIFNDLLTPEEIELIRKWGYGGDYVVRWPDGYVDVYDETNYSQMQEVINKWNSAIDGPVNLRLSSNPNSPVKVVFDWNIGQEGYCWTVNCSWDDYTFSEVMIKMSSDESSCDYPNTSYSAYLCAFNAVVGFNYWAEVSPTPFDDWSNFNMIPNTIKTMVHALYKVPPGYYLDGSKPKINKYSIVIENMQLGTKSGCACNCIK